MNNPTAKETNSSIIEPLQAVSTEAAMFAIRRAALLEKSRKQPPQRAGDTFTCGLGRMRQNETGGHEQDPSAVGMVCGSLRELHDFIKKTSRIGPKFNQVCLYAAAPKESGSARKDNHAFSQVVFMDLDGLCKSEADLDRVRQWRPNTDRIISSSSSHNPKAGKFNLRIILPINASLTYEEHAGVADILNQQLAEHMGSSEGIDPANKKSMQPMLLPAWRDEEVAEQAILEIYEGGGPVDVGFILHYIRKELAEQAALERSRRTAIPSMVGGCNIDRHAGALTDLQHFPVPAGCNRSNRDLYVACHIARDWGLDLDEAIPLLQQVYGPQGQDLSWIEAKAKSAWSATSASQGWRLRAAQARLPFNLEEVFPVAPPLVAPCALKEKISIGATDRLVTPPPVAPLTRGRGVQLCDRYLPQLASFADLPASVNYTKSACGTGKNARLAPAWQKLKADGGLGIIIGHRVSLSRGHAETAGIACYQDLTGEITETCAVCLDSIDRISLVESGPNMEVRDRKFAVVIIDESEQVGRHLFAETIRSKGKIGKVFSHLRALVKQADRLVLQDADLGPFSIFLARMLKGWTSPEQYDESLLWNTWIPDHLVAEIHSSEESYWTELVAGVQQGPVWEFSTTRAACEKHRKALAKSHAHLRVLAIHSGTTGQKRVQAALASPDLFKTYDVVLATPSVGTGVSVDVPDYFKVFGHARSGAGPLAQDVKQGLSRVRKPVGATWTIYCGGRVSWAADNAEIILRDLTIKSTKTLALLQGITWDSQYDPESQVTALRFDNPDLVRLQAEVLALNAKHGNHLHTIQLKDGTVQEGALITHLRESGIKVRMAGDIDPIEKKAVTEIMKAAAEEVKDEFAANVEAAPDITLEEADLLEGEEGTPEIEAQIAKARIRDFYGVAKVTKPLVRKDDRGRRRGKARTFAQVKAVQRGEKQAVALLDFREMQSGYSSHCRNHYLQAGLQTLLWSLFGIKDFEADAKAGRVLKVPQGILTTKLKDEVKRILGISLAKMEDKGIMALAGQLAARAGFKLAGKVIRGADGKLGREYRLDLESVAEIVGDSDLYYQRITGPKAGITALNDDDAEGFLRMIYEQDSILAA